MKRCSTLLTIREMQIKTTMRYHLIPIRIQVSYPPHCKKKKKQKIMLARKGCGKIRTLVYCWWTCKMV